MKNVIISILSSICIYNFDFWVDKEPAMIAALFIVIFVAIQSAEYKVEEIRRHGLKNCHHN